MHETHPISRDQLVEDESSCMYAPRHEGFEHPGVHITFRQHGKVKGSVLVELSHMHQQCSICLLSDMKSILCRKTTIDTAGHLASKLCAARQVNSKTIEAAEYSLRLTFASELYAVAVS